MLLANRRTSLFNQETSSGGYSKPAPGPDIVKLWNRSKDNYALIWIFDCWEVDLRVAIEEYLHEGAGEELPQDCV
jgi:hypothetical protein